MLLALAAVADATVSSAGQPLLITIVVAIAAALVTLVGTGVFRWWDSRLQNKATRTQFIAAIDIAIVAFQAVIQTKGHQAHIEDACDRVMNLALSKEFASAIRFREIEKAFTSLGRFEQHYKYVVHASKMRDAAWDEDTKHAVTDLVLDDRLREKHELNQRAITNALAGIVATAPEAIQTLQDVRGVVVGRLAAPTKT